MAALPVYLDYDGKPINLNIVPKEVIYKLLLKMYLDILVHLNLCLHQPVYYMEFKKVSDQLLCYIVIIIRIKNLTLANEILHKACDLLEELYERYALEIPWNK